MFDIITMELGGIEMLKKMNLPNKLTLVRMILVPFFIIAMALPSEWGWNLWTALGIFIVAAITDFVDGYLSRKNNQVTKFGKIMDPLADKLLISSGFIMLAGLQVIPAWIAAIIIFRDFFVNSLRMFGADKGSDLAAALSGKVKTIFQLVGVPLAILGTALGANHTFGIFLEKSTSMSMLELMTNVGMTIAIGAALLATVWSLVDYVVRFKKDVNVEE